MTHADTILALPTGARVMVCEPVPVRMSALMAIAGRGFVAPALMPGAILTIRVVTGNLMLVQDACGDLLHIDAALADNLEVVPG